MEIGNRETGMARKPCAAYRATKRAILELELYKKVRKCAAHVLII
jgi:hypothetical protein